MRPRLAATAGPGLAVASGLTVLVAHPPVGWWWTTFLSAPLLLAALAADGRAAAATGRRPRAGRLGVLSGLATFPPLLSWLILPAGFVGWGLLAFIQAAWFGVLARLVQPFLARGVLLALITAVGWTGIDAWRAIVPLNGFEWGAIAYAHVDGSWLLPVARLVGGRGITFLVVLVGAAAYVVIRDVVPAVRGRDGEPMERALGGVRGPMTLLLAGLLVSVLATIEPPPEVGELDVLAVQGNNVRHWEEERPQDMPLTIATNLRDLTIRAVEDGGAPDLTIWPESSIDRDPNTAQGVDLRAVVDEAAQAAGALLAGVTLDGPDPATTRYVAASLYEDGFDETDRYAKRQLVPFGEFVPARRFLDWFPPLDQVPRDTLPGVAHSMMLPGGVRVAPIICYETMFNGIVRSQIRAGDRDAQIILTLTNNASYGDTAMPRQHLAQSQLRAVETGRWVVHAAISGSSAFVAPDGTVEQATPLFELATIRRAVPLVEGSTPYLAIGDVVGWLTRALVVVLALGAVLAARSGWTAATG